MNQNKRFEMKVVDFHKFDIFGGRTVFYGSLEPEQVVVPNTVCDLFVADKLICTLTIESRVMLGYPATLDPNFHAVATLDDVELEKKLLNSTCVLREKI